MIILTVIKCDIDRFLKWGIALCAVAASITLGWAVDLFLWTPSSMSEMENDLSVKKLTQTAYLYPLDAIGSGPLALRPKIACGWVSRIAEEFSIIAFDSRPDVLQKEAKILVAIREGKEQSTIHNGKMIFLQERSEGKGLSLSENPTSLWVKPILLDNGNVLVEAGRKLISKEGSLIAEEKGEFTATPHRGASFRLQENQASCLGELKTAVYLGQDPLILKYGGKEYAAWKDKIKLEFTSESKTYALFVSQGDLLQFNDGEWRCMPIALSSHLPIARVISANAKGVEVQAWDESGFYSLNVKIEAGKLNPAAITHDLLPTSLRMRSNTQVSCVFGKKRLIIKKGDWLLKTAGGWRNLRKAEEIEDCLFHRIKGELFIFDGIEKQQGKSMLQGHLFDRARTNGTLISLPIDTEKKGSQRAANKKDKV